MQKQTKTQVRSLFIIEFIGTPYIEGHQKLEDFSPLIHGLTSASATNDTPGILPLIQ